jgi:hypothetical protein
MDFISECSLTEADLAMYDDSNQSIEWSRSRKTVCRLWKITKLAAAVLAFSFLSQLQLYAAPGIPSDPTQEKKTTIIRGEIVEKHDRLSDTNDPSNPEAPDIEWSHEFTISLSGKNQVSETWNNTRLGGGSRGFHRRRGPLANQSENNGTLGDKTGKVVWHILGRNKLQRILPGEHYLMMMDIEIGEDNSCRLDAKYLRQTGFVSVRMRRADTGEMANFSLPQVEKASCSIE